MRWLISIIVVALAVFNNVYAVSCTLAKVKVQNKNMILLGSAVADSKRVYFIENIGGKGLWVDHPVTHPSASAGWSSYIRAKNWSALVVDRKDFAISCAVIQPGKVDYQDCVRAISVCSPKEVTFKSGTKGTYWLAEDKSLDDILKEAAKRGVKAKM